MARSTKTLALIGVVTWLAASSPLLVAVALRPALLGEPRVAGWLVAFAAFGAGFAPMLLRRRGERAEAWGAAVQVVAAAAAAALVPFPAANIPAPAILMVVAAARFPLAGLPRTGLAVIAGQIVVLYLVYTPHLPTAGGVAAVLGAFGGFQLFGYAVAAMARREEQARADLDLALGELQATRGLVAAGSRLTERMRIARELHDSLGHDLTALSLHLELARHQSGAAARAAVDTARSLCQLLLAQLRDVLDDVRAADGADLEAAIREIVRFVPRPAVEVAVAGRLGSIDPVVAHEVLRCVQEVATNAMRHSGAEHLRLELARAGDELVVRARDDGRGLTPAGGGTGLRGMAERVAGLGGRLAVRPGPGERGVEVELAVPVAVGET